MSLTQRKYILLTVLISITAVVALLYVPTVQFIDVVHKHSYHYVYLPRTAIFPMDVSKEAPAKAVPILMYHGVRVKGELGTNTTRKNFIEHMEMLKREGYQTITTDEYYRFREGTFVLPPKPIIITFDDGRKDSYYTVDEVFRKLGFNATLFIATGKSNTNDPFFLSWDELRAVKSTGRWEFQAHGVHSHDEVVIDTQGTKGRYLSSRIYDPRTGLETVESFEKRILTDYENGIVDIIANLDVDPQYYAVPLNDYGIEQNSNYDKAIDFNILMTKKYFKLAFIEALENNNQVYETFYNYTDTNPYAIKRLEVKNMSAAELKFALTKYAPSAPDIVFPAFDPSENPLYRMQSLYGDLSTSSKELVLSTSASSTVARALFGDRGWQNYEMTLNIERGDVREASVVLYYTDDDNLLILNWDDYAIDVTERIDGVDTKIVEHQSHLTNGEAVEVYAKIQNGHATVVVDGVRLTQEYPIRLVRGAPGFGVWDPEGGTIKVSSLVVSPAQ